VLRSGEILAIRQLYEEGLSITEFARRPGKDRKTIRTWIQRDDLPRRQRCTRYCRATTGTRSSSGCWRIT
jgi:DNA-binding transcriptional regulator YiaG